MTTSHTSRSFDTVSAIESSPSSGNDSHVTVTMTTQVYSTSSSSLLELSNDYVTFSETMIIVTLNTYDMIYDLYFNTVIVIIVADAPTAGNNDNTYDDIVIIVADAPTAGNNNKIYDLYFNTALHTAIDTTFTTALLVSPSYDLDSPSKKIKIYRGKFP